MWVISWCPLKNILCAVIGVGGGDKGKVEGIGRAPVATELIDTLASVHRNDDAIALGVEVAEESLSGKWQLTLTFGSNALAFDGVVFNLGDILGPVTSVV